MTTAHNESPEPDSSEPAVALKVRRTITLDADLINEFGGEGDKRLSPEINAILRAEKVRRQRNRALDTLLAELEAERGPVDPDEVARFETLLR